MSQTLIDSEIIKMFIHGTDEQRKTISRLYPMLDLENLADEVLFEIMKNHAKGERKVHKILWKGRQMSFTVTIVEDDLN